MQILFTIGQRFFADPGDLHEEQNSRTRTTINIAVRFFLFPEQCWKSYNTALEQMPLGALFLIVDTTDAPESMRTA